jgi:hypothetical protein
MATSRTSARNTIAAWVQLAVSNSAKKGTQATRCRTSYACIASASLSFKPSMRLYASLTSSLRFANLPAISLRFAVKTATSCCFCARSACRVASSCGPRPHGQFCHSQGRCFDKCWWCVASLGHNDALTAQQLDPRAQQLLRCARL